MYLYDCGCKHFHKDSASICNNVFGSPSSSSFAIFNIPRFFFSKCSNKLFTRISHIADHDTKLNKFGTRPQIYTPHPKRTGHSSKSMSERLASLIVKLNYHDQKIRQTLAHDTQNSCFDLIRSQQQHIP